VHGYINISNLAQKIIDTPEFQRLRKLKQLGTCSYVFPSATHTRFEHSIGTYFLAGKIMDCIIERTDAGDTIADYLKSIPELKSYYDSDSIKITKYIRELVKIAALCHDIGHGPFSHLFDDHFLVSLNKKSKHEDRSNQLIEIIIKRELPFMVNEIKFIQSLITPNDTNSGFLYQIVSNNLNGLDVDKYDYIARDSYMLGIKTGFDHSRLVSDIIVSSENYNICYPKQIVFEITKLFQSRYNLHKQIYCHKSVISSQLMIIDMMKLVNPLLNLSDSVDDMNKFIKLTDEYVLIGIELLDLKTIDSKYFIDIVNAKCILERINCHNFYKMTDSVISDKKIEYEDKDDDYIVFQSKIGFGKKNSLDNIYTYSTKNPKNTPQKALIDNVSYLIPKVQEEFVYMKFLK